MMKKATALCFLINNQVARWKFSYLTKNDRIQHSAIKAAAKFIRENPDFFPNGIIPTKAFQLAILAIKVNELFLTHKYKPSETMSVESGRKIAKAVIEANENFGVKRKANHCH